jgi:hypothetical protein
MVSVGDPVIVRGFKGIVKRIRDERVTIQPDGRKKPEFVNIHEVKLDYSKKLDTELDKIWVLRRFDSGIKTYYDGSVFRSSIGDAKHYSHRGALQVAKRLEAKAVKLTHALNPLSDTEVSKLAEEIQKVHASLAENMALEELANQEHRTLIASLMKERAEIKEALQNLNLRMETIT